MEQIGQMAREVLARVSAHSRSLAPVTPQAGSKPPTTVDRHCDVVLPARLFSAWVPAGGAREIVRPLADAERNALQARADELRDAMTPCQAHQHAAAESAIAAMLSGFRVMRQKGEDVEATVRISRHILRDFPLWAILRGCLLIAQNSAGLDPRWAPNDAELCGVVREVVRFHRAALDRCEALLCAPVENSEPARPTPEEIQEQIARLELPARPREWDGNHMARVLADLEARKQAAADA